MNSDIQEIVKRIISSKRVFLSLHPGPDGDSLGSSVAMQYLLENHFKKKTILVSPDNLDGQLASLYFTKSIIFDKELGDYSFGKDDLIIMLDTGTLERFSERTKRLISENKNKIINIDHHKTNPKYGYINLIDSSQGSCASVLLHLFQEMNISIDKELATRLLCGICTDTWFFTYDSSGNAVKDGAFLIEKGANYELLLQTILFSTPLKIKQYHAILALNFKIDKRLRFGISTASLKETKRLNLTSSEVRGGSNYFMDVKEVDFLVIMTELEDKIKCSLRSRRGVDVSVFAEALGGGGHKFAAAFILPKMPMAKAEKKVFDVIKKLYKPKKQHNP